jgi:hypothetical protein
MRSFDLTNQKHIDGVKSKHIDQLCILYYYDFVKLWILFFHLNLIYLVEKLQNKG